MKIGFIGLGNVGGKLSGRVDRYGPRVWSSMVVKRLEDDCDIDFRADGFPEYLVDIESPQKGKEVKVRDRDY